MVLRHDVACVAWVWYLWLVLTSPVFYVLYNDCPGREKSGLSSIWLLPSFWLMNRCSNPSVTFDRVRAPSVWTQHTHERQMSGVTGIFVVSQASELGLGQLLSPVRAGIQGYLWPLSVLQVTDTQHKGSLSTV